MKKGYVLVDASHIIRSTTEGVRDYVCLYYRNAKGKEEAMIIHSGQKGYIAGKKAAQKFAANKKK